MRGILGEFGRSNRIYGILRMVDLREYAQLTVFDNLRGFGGDFFDGVYYLSYYQQAQEKEEQEV